MRPERQRLLLFLLSVILATVALTWPWEFVQKGYGRLFVGTGNALLRVAGSNTGLLGSRGAVLLVQDYDRSSQHDVRVALLHLDRGRSSLYGRRVSSRHLGYIPAITFLVLALATPVPWRRKLRVTLVGFLVVQLFVVARVAWLLLDAFHGSEPHCLFRLGPAGGRMLRLITTTVVEAPAATYIVPVVVWALFALDLETIALFGAHRPSDDAPPSAAED